MSTAVVTMVYNEPVYLPIWIKYYGGVFGESHLHVIDHGSDDGSTDHIGSVNKLILPRDQMNDDQRTLFINDFCSALLKYYSHVIYIDVDEFLVADPRKWQNLAEFCDSVTDPIVTSIGLNLIHDVANESEIDLRLPVLSQRSWAFPVSPMCKPNIISRPVSWLPGFHGCDHQTSFSDIYMFHLRYFDLQAGLTRLARSREISWSRENAGAHQRISDETWAKWISNFNRFERIGDLFGEAAQRELDKFTTHLAETTVQDKSGKFNFPRLVPEVLVRIPEKLRTVF